MRQPVWFACGDTGLLLDFLGYGPGLGQAAIPTTDRANLTRKARQLGQMMREKTNSGTFHGLTDVVPGLCSVLFHYDPVIITAAELKQIVSLQFEKLDLSQQTPARLWRLPVCYEEEFAPDLKDVVSKANLTSDEVIALHTSKILEVAIMGFLPGLGYLTGVDDALHLPRRSVPRTFVPQGSVGLAMDQTVIYPLNSPGGWNLIGRMPIPLFDQKRENPILFSAGDQVSFYAVNADKYEELAASCVDGNLPICPEKANEAAL